jgi:hypothetical protein
VTVLAIGLFMTVMLRREAVAERQRQAVAGGQRRQSVTGLPPEGSA